MNPWAALVVLVAIAIIIIGWKGKPAIENTLSAITGKQRTGSSLRA